MFIKIKALYLLRKLNWDISIDSLLDFVKSRGINVKICDKNKFTALIRYSGNDCLLYPKSFIYHSDNSKTLILQEEYTNIDILVQLGHILLKHSELKGVSGNTQRENYAAMKFAGFVLRPNNSLIAAYRNMWICTVILSVLLTITLDSFVELKLLNDIYKYVVVNDASSVAEKDCAYVAKGRSIYHREFCGYIKNGAVKVNIADAVKVGYQPCKICNPNDN